MQAHNLKENDMYTIEKDVEYKTVIGKCKYPELRRICNEMELRDSVVVPSVKEATALQMYLQRKWMRENVNDFDPCRIPQISRRKRESNDMGETLGYRVWRLI